MSYAPCHFCGTVTSIQADEPICGTCEIMLSNVDQRENLERSQREENELWELEADPIETDLFHEQLRQQMEEDDQRLYLNRLRGNYRRVYMDSEQLEEQEQANEEEEFYQNDQDDFNFDMSYQENIQAIRDSLSSRPYEASLDRGALVQRLIRVFMNNDGNLILEDDASQSKGATESDIAILKKRTSNINDPERNIECAICTEKFEYLELTQLPCNHEYHSECIQHWLKLNASCPICRQSISSTQSKSANQQGEEEPDIIIIRRDTTRQNNNIHFLDDVD